MAEIMLKTVPDYLLFEKGCAVLPLPHMLLSINALLAEIMQSCSFSRFKQNRVHCLEIILLVKTPCPIKG